MLVLGSGDKELLRERLKQNRPEMLVSFIEEAPFGVASQGNQKIPPLAILITQTKNIFGL